MKKLFFLIIMTAALSSCGGSTPSSPNNSQVNDLLGAVRYTRDARTGLCFAVVQSETYAGYLVSSITCVPCDSLKQVIIVDIPSTK